jgi:hypothetical protein
MNASVCDVTLPSGLVHYALVQNVEYDAQWAHVRYKINLAPGMVAESWFGMAMTIFVTSIFIGASHFFTR